MFIDFLINISIIDLYSISSLYVSLFLASPTLSEELMEIK